MLNYRKRWFVKIIIFINESIFVPIIIIYGVLQRVHVGLRLFQIEKHK